MDKAETGETVLTQHTINSMYTSEGDVNQDNVCKSRGLYLVLVVEFFIDDPQYLSLCFACYIL